MKLNTIKINKNEANDAISSFQRINTKNNNQLSFIHKTNISGVKKIEDFLNKINQQTNELVKISISKAKILPQIADIYEEFDLQTAKISKVKHGK